MGYQEYIDDLVQDCSNSIANALELLQSCTKPSISSIHKIGRSTDYAHTTTTELYMEGRTCLCILWGLAPIMLIICCLLSYCSNMCFSVRYFIWYHHKILSHGNIKKILYPANVECVFNIVCIITNTHIITKLFIPRQQNKTLHKTLFHLHWGLCVVWIISSHEYMRKQAGVIDTYTGATL